MKKLAFIFSIVAFSLNAQIKVESAKSFSEDKILAKQLFASINSYRNSIGVASYIWEENYYVTAKTHNDYLAKNGLWGHRRNETPGAELIVAVTLINNETVTPELYAMLIDSCMNQWKHSEFHHEVLKAPILSKLQPTYIITVTDINLSILLTKYGAVSVNVVNHGKSKHVTCILHLGHYTDPNIWLEY
jgi:hypothetical protein